MAEIRRILVVEDHEYVGKGIVSQIQQDCTQLSQLLDIGNLELEATAVTSLRLAERALQAHDVDLVILDLDLNDGRSEFETLHELTAIRCRAKSVALVVLYSATRFERRDGISFLRKALNCPEYNVRGVIPKSTPASRVKEGFARLLAKEEWYPADLIRALAGFDDADEREMPRLGLTPREWDVAKLLSEGLPNRNIAIRLNISELNTRQIVSAILEKLSMKNRTEVAIAVVKAEQSRNQ
jgi:DNA-binding NarL/FixJ family response regulator